MERITVDELYSRFKAQGVSDRKDIAFKCPICATVQSMRSLIKAGAGETEDEVEKFVGFSCVGRFSNAGPHKPGTKPGKGCDWTLGGVFRVHTLEVETPDGKVHPRFEIATPEEAQEHARALLSQDVREVA